MNKNIKNALLLSAVMSSAVFANAPDKYSFEDLQDRINTGKLVRSDSFAQRQEEANKKNSETEALAEFRAQNNARRDAIKTAFTATKAKVDAMAPGALAQEDAFADLPKNASAVAVPELTGLFTDAEGTNPATAADLANPSALYKQGKLKNGVLPILPLKASMPEFTQLTTYNAKLAEESSDWDAKNAEAKRQWQENQDKKKADHAEKSAKFQAAKDLIGDDADTFASKFGQLDESEFKNIHTWSVAQEEKNRPEVVEFYEQNKKTEEGDLTKPKADAIAAVAGFANLGGNLESSIKKLINDEPKKAQGKLTTMLMPLGYQAVANSDADYAYDFSQGNNVDAVKIRNWLSECDAAGNGGAVRKAIMDALGLTGQTPTAASGGQLAPAPITAVTGTSGSVHTDQSNHDTGTNSSGRSPGTDTEEGTTPPAHGHINQDGQIWHSHFSKYLTPAQFEAN